MIAVLVYTDRFTLLSDTRRAAVLQFIRKNATPFCGIFIEEGSETILWSYNRQVRWFPADYSSNIREPATIVTRRSGNLYIQPKTHRWSTENFIKPTDDADTIEVFITRNRRLTPLRRHQTPARRRLLQRYDHDDFRHQMGD